MPTIDDAHVTEADPARLPSECPITEGCLYKITANRATPYI
jgi:hypothetical protein